MGDLKKEKKSTPTQVQLNQQNNIYLGPLIDPDKLAQFDLIQQGYSERILKMAEDEQKHRHSMNKEILDEQKHQTNLNYKKESRGQIFGIIGLVSILLFGSYLAYSDNGKAAAAVVIATLASVVAVFVYSGNRMNKEKNQSS